MEKWNGIERRGEHNCVQLETMGRVKEFIENSKGLKATMFTISFAILLQVGAFLYLWGSLTTTVKVHDTAIASINGKLDKLLTIVPLVHANNEHPKN